MEKLNVLTLTDTLHKSGAEKVAIDLSIAIKDYTNNNVIVYATRSGGVLETSLKKNRVDYYILERKNKFNFKMFFQLIKLLKSKKVDIIHSHKFGSNFWAVIIGKLLKIKVVCHIHGQNYQNSIIDRLANKFIAYSADAIISVSLMEEKLFKDYTNINPDKVYTVYNGLEVEKFKFNNLRYKSKDKVVGIVAALREEKRVDLLIHAAKEVLKVRPNTTFIIVGDGPKKAELQQLAFNLGISKNIVFTGFCDNAVEYIRKFDLGVLCSIREGLPLVLLEYLLCKTPIIATDVGGVSEIIRDGYNGILIPPDNSFKLADAILDVLEERVNVNDYVKNGFSFAVNSLSIKNMSEEVNKIYQKCFID